MPNRSRIVQGIQGSLLGQCLGDALGFVVEGCSRADCTGYVADILLAGHAGSLGRRPHPFGQYTDDSQLARELAESIVAHRAFVLEDYAGRIAAIFTDGRIVGRGRATEQAALRLAAGIPWSAAGAPPPDAGNGGAMRAAPIGWLYAADDPALLRAACDQARITHADPRAQAGAAAIALAVALALEDISPDAIPHRLAESLAPLSLDLAEAIRQLDALRRLPPEEAHPMIAAMGSTAEMLAKDPWAGTISPFVIPSVAWSLYSVLRAPDDYWAAICTAIAGGGDADTTAAMAGAIAGARLGAAALPDSLARRLNDRGRWGYEDLVGLAERIATLRPG